MKKRSTTHYVNNKDFYNAIIKYRENKKIALEQGKQKPVLPSYIGECIMMIANKLSTKPNFYNYSFKEEMVSDGIENCFMYFDSFNPELSNNPFAYFTQIIKNAFLRRIRKEEKNRYATYKIFQETMLIPNSDSHFTDSEDNHLISSTLYDNIDRFMGSFEEKERERKRKRKEAARIKSSNTLTQFIENSSEQQI